MSLAREQAAALARLLDSEAEIVRPDEAARSAYRCAIELTEHAEYVLAIETIDRVLSRIGARVEPTLALELGVARVRALLNSERLEEATKTIAEMRATFQGEAFERSDAWAMLRAYEGSCLWRRGEVDEAVRRLTTLLAELAQRPDSAATCLCALELGIALRLAADWTASRDAITEGWVAARRIGNAHWIAVAQLNLSRLEQMRCHWTAAAEAIKEAFTQFDDLGNTLFSAQCLRIAAIVDWKRGRCESALKFANDSRDVADSSSLPRERWLATLVRSLTLIHLGRFEEAKASLTSDPEWLVVSRSSRPSLLTAEFLADIDLEQGNAAAALPRYEAVLAAAMALVPRGDIVAELRRRIAECHLLVGEPRKALDEAQEGLAHCSEIHERYDGAATHRIIALAHAALGQNDEARKAFELGFTDFEEIETPYEWGKLWVAYGDWLASEGAAAYNNSSAALEAYRAAIDHFERIGAEYWLSQARQRLEALEARMRAENETYSPTHAKIRPARRSRRGADAQRRAQWAFDTFGIVTRNAPFITMLEQIARVAVSDLPVLVLGESGTGKELIARGIHQLSGRTGEFMAINCSAVPEAMLEGEFFGYLKGAFTNAVADKPGLLEVADGGSVFLDEIGEMSPDLQSKLLRFLESGTLRRIGATRDTSVQTRIVAATNRTRAALQSGNGFRSDLYYRLAHSVFELPPLRQRGDDVELLIDHLLDDFNRREGKRTALTLAVRSRLTQHSWPGNVRELRAVLHYMVVAASPEAALTPRDLPPLERANVPSTFEDETNADEKRRIVRALEQSKFVKTEAAELLRISRTTLLSKMKRLGIEG